MVLETRFSRYDTWLVNGLTAFKLETTPESPGFSLSKGRARYYENCYLGFKLYKRSEGGVETLIKDDGAGNPVQIGVWTVYAHTENKRPNAAGTYQAWSTFGDGLYHWDRLSDQNVATGVQVTGDTTLKETENVEDISSIGAGITGVTPWILAKATGTKAAETAVIILRTHGTDYESPARTISRTAFTWYYGNSYVNNPYTGQPWTLDEINAMEIGVRAATLDSTDIIQVAEMYAAVGFAGGGSLKNVTTAIPSTSMVDTDSIVVYYFGKVGDDGTWDLIVELGLTSVASTPQLGASQYGGNDETFYAWGEKTYDGAITYIFISFGNLEAYNTKIENFSWTVVPPAYVPVMKFHRYGTTTIYIQG